MKKSKKENIESRLIRYGNHLERKRCTRGRHLSEEELSRVLHYEPVDCWEARAIDLFKFMYYSAGISLYDVLTLEESNFVDNNLSYTRKKTKQQVTVPLLKEAMIIANKYRARFKRSKYIFFEMSFDEYLKRRIFVSDIHLLAQQRCRRIDYTLRQIGEKLNLSIPFTSVVARNSGIYQLFMSKVPYEVIAKLYGISYQGMPVQSQQENDYKEFMDHLVLRS